MQARADRGRSKAEEDLSATRRRRRRRRGRRRGRRRRRRRGRGDDEASSRYDRRRGRGALAASCSSAASERIPGGVNSPVRAFRGVGGDPVFIARGEGAYLYDVDGNEYIDYVGSWGPLHPRPRPPRGARRDRATPPRDGTSFGAPTEREVEFAEALCARGAVDGDGARWSRRAPRRRWRAARWRAASPGATRSSRSTAAITATPTACSSRPARASRRSASPARPASPPAPPPTRSSSPCNDLTRRCARRSTRNRDEIAAVIVEPVVRQHGLRAARARLPRRRCARSRAQHGARAHLRRGHDRLPRRATAARRRCYGITPDLTCLGKIVGGGLPAGGLRRPRRHHGQARAARPGLPGGHALGQPAGGRRRACKTLELLRAARHLRAARSTSARARRRARRGRAAKPASPLTSNRVGSMFTGFFTDGAGHRLRDREDVATPRASAASSTPCSTRGVYLRAVAVRGGLRLVGARRTSHRPHPRAARRAFASL